MKRYDTVPVRRVPHSDAPLAELIHYGGMGATPMKNPRVELNKMKRSLKQWLKFRDMNSAAGLTPAEAAERTQIERTLSAKMQALLFEVYGSNVRLPSDAPSLAKLIISGTAPQPSGPQAQGIMPLLIVVGAVALVLMAAVNSYADYAKEKERYECIAKYGAWQCDTSGQLMKWGVIVGIGYLAWTKLGLGGLVMRLARKRKRR